MRTWRYAEFSDRGHARYGDTFTARIGGLGALVLTKDRDAIRRLYTGDPLAKRHANDLLRPFVGDESLLVLEPAEHLARRRMLLPPFHGERVQSYARLMERLVSAELDRLVPGDVVAVQPIAQALTLDVILQAVLGVSDAATRRRLRRIFDSVMSPVNSIGLFVPQLARRSPWNPLSRRPWRLKDELDALLLEHISATRADELLEKREDILAMMVLARDEDGAALTDEQLRDELITLIAAGHETTATAIAWGVELLAHNPSAMAKARAGDEAYLEALVKEILRIRPPSPIAGGRYVGEPFPIGDWMIPPEMSIVVDAYGVHSTPTSTPSLTCSAPSASWRTRPTDTRSFRSAAALTAASVRRSHCSRSRSCCARSSRASSSRRYRLRSRARCRAAPRSRPAGARAFGLSKSAEEGEKVASAVAV